MCRSYWHVHLFRLWLKLGALRYFFPRILGDRLYDLIRLYNIVSQSVIKINIAQKLTDRVPWERGLLRITLDSS